MDDINIYDGACAGATDAPTCQFYCDNGECLKDATLVCNFQADCSDSSDELNCGMYHIQFQNLYICFKNLYDYLHWMHACVIQNYQLK